MVGGLDDTMLGMVVASQFGMAGNWPYGAALSIFKMFFVMGSLGLLFAIMRTKGILVGEGGQPSESGAHDRAPRAGRILGAALFALPYLFLYAPLLIIALFSFNTSNVQTFPLTGFTFDWYFAMFQNTALIDALKRSLLIGAGALLVSVIVGTAFAMIFSYDRSPGMRAVQQLITLPVAIPGVVLGITLVLVFELLKVPVGLPRVILGHAAFVMPVVMLTVMSRISKLDPGLIEASCDLGAGPVTLPPAPNPV